MPMSAQERAELDQLTSWSGQVNAYGQDLHAWREGVDAHGRDLNDWRAGVDAYGEVAERRHLVFGRRLRNHDDRLETLENLTIRVSWWPLLVGIVIGVLTALFVKWNTDYSGWVEAGFGLAVGGIAYFALSLIQGTRSSRRITRSSDNNQQTTQPPAPTADASAPTAQQPAVTPSDGTPPAQSPAQPSRRRRRAPAGVGS